MPGPGPSIVKSSEADARRRRTSTGFFTPGTDGFITPNDAIGAAGGPGTLGAPAGATINLSGVNNLKTARGADVDATTQKVAESVFGELTRQFDRQLNRSSQVIFGLGKAYSKALASVAVRPALGWAVIAVLLLRLTDAGLNDPRTMADHEHRSRHALQGGD